MMRIVQTGARRIIGQDAPAAQYARLVKFIREGTEGFDPDHIQYLIGRNISLWDLPPKWMQALAIGKLTDNMDLCALSHEDHLRGALEARPDLEGIITTPEGRKWMEMMFRWW